MYYLYILRSENRNRYYIGISENLEKRLKKHNTGSVRSTKAYKPWQLIYKEEYSTKSDARHRELRLKNVSAAKEELIKKLEMASSSNG